MDVLFFVPAVLARIRIPIPAEWVGPILLVFLIVAFIASFFLQRQDWKRWGLPALGALVVTDLIFMVARFLVGSGSSAFPLASIVSPMASDALLVWSALLVWAFRKRLDAANVLLAAVVYVLFSSPVTALLVGSPLGLFHPGGLVLRTLWASCLLGALAVLGPRIRPAWAGAFAGVTVGFLVGGLASAVASPILFPGSLVAGTIAQQLPRALGWGLAHGVVTGGLFALAVWLLKPEQA